MKLNLRLTIAATLTLATTAAFAGSAAAAPTTLDLTFGKDGYAFVNEEPGAADPSFNVGGATELPDGYATVDERCGDDVCATVVARFDEDGKPVLDFGAAGQASVTHPTYRFVGKDLTATGDDSGNLLLVGHVIDEFGDQKFAAALIDSGGVLIEDFGVDGFEVWGDWHPSNGVTRVVSLGTEGSIAVAVGESSLGGTGSRVVGFSEYGARVLDVEIDGPDDTEFLVLDVLPDSNALYLSGFHVDGGIPQAAVARLANGFTFDAAWDDDGIAPVGGTGFGAATQMMFAPGGGLLVAGSLSASLSDSTGFVTKLDTSGEVDTAFGVNGVANCTVPVDGSCQFTSLELTAGGKILAGGKTTDADSNAASLIARLTPTGQPDAKFVAGGEYAFTAGLASQGVTELFSAAADKIVFRAEAVGDDGGGGVQGAALGRLEGGNIPDPPDPVDPVPPLPYPEPPATLPLSAKFTLKGKLKAAKFKTITGTAAGTGLKRVEVSIQRIDKKLLKKKQCLFLKNARGAFAKIKAAKKKCVPGKALAAKGTTKWSFKLLKKLPPGKYVVSVRPVGDVKGAFINKKLTLTK